MELIVILFSLRLFQPSNCFFSDKGLVSVYYVETAMGCFLFAIYIVFLKDIFHTS